MNPTPAQQLESILLQEIHHTARLADILQAERAALIQSEVGAIDDLNQQKQPLVMQLESLGRQRERLLQQCGLPPGKLGLQTLIDQLDTQTQQQLNQCLDQLREKAQACQRDNQINGGIVNVHRQFISRAMNVLRGRDPEMTAYGPAGRFDGAIAQQPLLARV